MSLFTTLFGRPLKTSEAHQERVGPLKGVPILGLDAIGSASYGPEAALMVLLPLGTAGLFYVREVALAILVLLAILFFSYRQTIAAYPNGGGSYAVACANLGKNAGLIAAASLLLDYVLNVAVGISAGVGALESAFPALQKHTLAACLVLLALITVVNLRGVRDSGLAWTLPTYVFVFSFGVVISIGIWKSIQAEGHPIAIIPTRPLAEAVTPVGLWLLLRAFASGCTAMTGVEAVSNGVPIFAEPKTRNAQMTLTLICSVLAAFVGGIVYLVHSFKIGAMPQEMRGYESIISQLTGAVVGRGTLYYVTIGSLLAVLALSANTSFAGFPRLCRLLSEDKYLPSGFANPGRRLVYTAGITILAALSAILLIVFNGLTQHLIPLFAVGAFGAFTMSQAGMVVHWRRLGRGVASPSLIVNAVGAMATAAALVVIIVAKFEEGAWITVLIIPSLVSIFLGIRKHYARVLREIRPPVELQVWKVRPLRVVIPVDGWNRLSERAVRFALRISDNITAVHVTRDETNRDLVEIWRERIEEPARCAGLPEPRLKVIHSPYRTLIDPLLSYIKSVQEEDSDSLIAVVIPELVHARWWEYLLHNQYATLLKTTLLLNEHQRVVVINTPWYLRDEPDKPGFPAQGHPSRESLPEKAFT